MLSAVIGHLVGDYIIQNDWMALNKKKSSFHCAVHCALWTFSVMSFSIVADWRIALILFGTHFFQDRTNVIRSSMAIFGQEKFATGPCAPWSIIVVDNVWHIVTIFAVWKAFEL